jgi:hypothetical protein
MSYIPVNHHRKNSSGGDSVESKREQYKTTGRQKKAQNFNQAQKKGHSRAGSLNLPSVKFSHKRSCNQLIADLLVHLSTENADPNKTVELACSLANAAKKNAAKKKKEPLEVVTRLISETRRMPKATWPIIAENLKQAPPDKAKEGALYLHLFLEMMTAANAPPPDEMAPDEMAPVPTAIPYGSSISPQPMGPAALSPYHGDPNAQSYYQAQPYGAFPATAGPYGSYGYAPPMETAVVTPYYGDPYAPSYYQGLPYSAVTAYGAPLPVSGPVVAPPQAPPPPIATSPAPITDWKGRMSERVVDLLSRLLDGDKVGVGFGFRLLQEIAREQKFNGDDLDGLIAAALEDRTLEQLVPIDNYAKLLLPEENLLAASMRLGIARMLLPMKFVEAVIQEKPARWSIAGEELRKCCNPAKRNDPKPTEGEAKSMMQKMLERVLDRVSSSTLLLLNQRTATDPQDDPAILVLMLLLEGKYARAIADAETNI